jgi:hypothetical protein
MDTNEPKHPLIPPVGMDKLFFIGANLCSSVAELK